MRKGKLKLIDKGLKKLLMREEKKILSQGYKSVDEFIDALKKVPIKDLKKKEKELKNK